MKLNFRHGLVRIPNSQDPQFLVPRGNTIDLVVETPLVFTISQGSSDYLVEERKGSISAWGPFSGSYGDGSSVASSVFYLYWDVDISSGLLKRGFTSVRPELESTVIPSIPAIGQHWYDRTRNVMVEWTGSYWREVLRVFVGEYKNFSTVKYYPIGTQVGLNVACSAGYILFGPDGKAIKNPEGRFLTTDSNLNLNVGTFTSPIDLETSSTYATAVEPIPRLSLVYAADDGKIGLASSEDLSKAAIGFVVENGIPGNSLRYINRGIVTDEQWNWTADQINKTLYCGPTGGLTFDKSTVSTQKVARIVGTKSILLNIEVDSTEITETQTIFDAKSSVKGIVFLSVDPVSEVHPIAVGTNDPRMTDSRKPLAHMHQVSDVQNLQAIINDLQTNKIGSTGGNVSGYLNLNYVPTDPSHATNKRYVDATVQGYDVKQSVRVATTEAIPFYGLQKIDGIQLNVGDRVLVKDQTDKAQNGIYVAQETTWTRSIDANDNVKISSGMFTFVDEGAINKQSGWVGIVKDTAYQLNVSKIEFFQFTGLGQISVDKGLSKSGNLVSLRLNPTLSFDDIGNVGQTVISSLTPGSYNKVLVDEYGRVVTGSNMTSSDIPEGSNLYYTDGRVTDLLHGAVSSVLQNNLTSDVVLISDQNGKIIASTFDAAELAKLSGLKSNVQTQIDSMNSDFNAKIDQEIQTRQDTVEGLSVALDQEIQNRTSAVNTVDQKITAEISQRTAIDNATDARIGLAETNITAVTNSNNAHINNASIHVTPAQKAIIDTISYVRNGVVYSDIDGNFSSKQFVGSSNISVTSSGSNIIFDLKPITTAGTFCIVSVDDTGRVINGAMPNSIHDLGISDVVLTSGGTMDNGVIEGTTIGLNSPTQGKFTSLIASSIGVGPISSATGSTTFTVGDLSVDVSSPLVNLSADNFFISSATNLVVTSPMSTFSGDLTVTGKLVAQSATDTDPGLMAPSYKTFIDGITLTPSQINSLTTDYTPTADLSTSIVAEGTNLYFTDARARSAISVTGSLSYDAVNGVISFNDAVTSVNDRTGAVVLTSTEITEGSNLYFTDSRARNAISGTGGVVYDSATGSITLDSNVPKKDTINVWTKQQACSMVSSNVSGSTTVNLDLGNVITLTPTAAFDIATVNNAIAGGCYVFVIKQGATPFAGTFSSSKFKWANGVAPILTAEANAVDVITFISDGTNLYTQSNYNYK